MLVGTWNLGGLGGKGGEVCEELRRRIIDVCCLQEVIWRGMDAGDKRKESFYDELRWEWDMHSADDLAICLGDFNGYVGRHIDDFHVVYFRGIWKEECYWSIVWRRNYVCQIHGLRERKSGR